MTFYASKVKSMTAIAAAIALALSACGKGGDTAKGEAGGAGQQAGPQATDAAPKSGRGWVIGAIVSALLVVAFFGTMVYSGMQLRAQNREWQDVQDQRTSAKSSLDQKQDELDKVKKELEEAQK